MGRRQMAADDHAEIASLKKRLAELDVEREGLLASLEQLQQRNNSEVKLSSQALNAASAATALSNAEKVMLFRSLFRGRDDVFPQRFRHVAQLRRFGASITAGAGAATVDGCRWLHGATVVASDLRASSALVLAALAASGRSTVRRIDHLGRGYESLDVKLRSLGARIERVTLDDADRRTARSAIPVAAAG